MQISGRKRRQGLLLLRTGGGGHNRVLTVKPGGNDGDHDLLAHVRIGRRSPDDDRVFVSLLLDEAGGLSDLMQAHGLVSHHVDEDAACALNAAVTQERAVDGHLGRLAGAVFPTRNAGSHHGLALVRHDGPDVGKVEVHHAVSGDEVRDALNALTQHVISIAKGLNHRGPLADHSQEVVVGNDNERVHLILEVHDSTVGRLASLPGFKLKGQGHHPNGEGTQFPGHLSNDRRASGSRSATHSGSHKDHVGSLQGFSDLVHALLSSGASHLRFGASAQPASALMPQLQLALGEGLAQVLEVGVGGNVLHPIHLLLDHAVDGIASPTSDSDHLDARRVVADGLD